MKRLHARLLAQRLLALFAAGWLLWSFPLLRLWLGEAASSASAVDTAHVAAVAGSTVFGLPLLPVALFVAWLLLIALLARLMETGSTA